MLADFNRTDVLRCAFEVKKRLPFKIQYARNGFCSVCELPEQNLAVKFD